MGVVGVGGAVELRCEKGGVAENVRRRKGAAAHLEGGREHRTLQRASLGDALVEVERLRDVLAKVLCEHLLHGRDAHRAAEDLDAGDLLHRQPAALEGLLDDLLQLVEERHAQLGELVALHHPLDVNVVLRCSQQHRAGEGRRGVSSSVAAGLGESAAICWATLVWSGRGLFALRSWSWSWGGGRRRAHHERLDGNRRLRVGAQDLLLLVGGGAQPEHRLRVGVGVDLVLLEPLVAEVVHLRRRGVARRGAWGVGRGA